MTIRATGRLLARKVIKGPPLVGKQDKRLTSKEEFILKLIRPVEQTPSHTPEERARLRELMIRYGKLKRLQTREMQKRLQEADRGIWAALDAMPHNRRVEALTAEAKECKYGIPIFTHTPPIKGFDINNLKQS